MAYDNLVHRLSDKIDNLTRLAGSQHPLEGAPARAADSPAGSPGPQYADIPLFPIEADYPHLNRWGQKDYSALRHGKKIKVDDNNPTLTIFWELPNGNILPPERRKAVTNDLRAWWQQEYEDGIQLKPIMDMGWQRCNAYRTHIEAKHPWLCLCSDHWKADMLWKNHFSR